MLQQRILICSAASRDAARTALTDIVNSNQSDAFTSELSPFPGPMPPEVVTHYASSSYFSGGQVHSLEESAAVDLASIDNDHPWVMSTQNEAFPAMLERLELQREE